MLNNSEALADVSVIIPHYNSSSTIRRCLNSVFNQTLCTREIIIIDDLSSMEEYKALESVVDSYNYITDEIKVKLIRNNENLGAGETRNVGICNSSCKYIAFLDADDVWHPLKIELQYSMMEKLEAHMSSHAYIPDLNQIRTSSDFKVRMIKEVTKINFMILNPFSTPCVMIRRETVKGFIAGLRYSEDYICWIRNISAGKAYFIDIPLAGGYKAPVGQSGLSSQMIEMHRGIMEGLGLLYHKREIGIGFYLIGMISEKMKFPLRVRRWKRR